jgi:hypothetical protein
MGALGRQGSTAITAVLVSHPIKRAASPMPIAKQDSANHPVRAGLARRQIRLRIALMLVGNLILATVAWYLVGLFMG